MFGTRCADRLSGAERAAGFDASNLAYKLHSKDAGGSRTRSELLCRQPPRRWASASRTMPSPGIEPGLQPSQGCVRIRHTPRTEFSFSPWLRQGVGHHTGRQSPAWCYPLAEPGAKSDSVPSRGIEPLLRRSKRRVRLRHTHWALVLLACRVAPGLKNRGLKIACHSIQSGGGI